MPTERNAERSRAPKTPIGGQRGDNLIKGLFEVPREHVAPERARRPEMGIVIAGQRPQGTPGLP